jgi:hypothetical protein
MKGERNYKMQFTVFSRQAKIKGSTKVEDTKTAKPNLKRWIAVFLFLALIFGITNELLAGLNIEVPLEMVDFGLNSVAGTGSPPTTQTNFGRSGLSLTGDDYDGATYYFEIVAKNTYGYDCDVFLRDYTSGTSKATITVPANTTNFTRYRVSWIPTDNTKRAYFVRMEDTASAGQLVVQTARIIVQQTNATKTRIQIPLVQKEHDLSAAPTGNLATTTSTTYVQDSPMKYSLWKKDTSVYADLAATNPWSLEAVLSSNNASGYAYAALFNATDNSQVTGTEIYVYGTTWDIKDVSFGDTATNFHNLDNFEARIKSNNASYTAELRSAVRLYVRLTNLTQAEVLYRVGRARAAGTALEDTEEQRVLLDTSLFANPLFYFEASGYCADNDQRVFLRDHSTNDSGTDGSNVSGSGINFNSASKTIVRAFDISPTSGNRFYTYITSSTSNLELNHAWLVVQVGKGMTIIGDGTSPANKFVGSNNTNKAVSSFTLSTSSGTDTVTGMIITGTNTANVATSGVKIYRDNGTTANEWDTSDTLVGTASFSGDTATFTGLNIAVSTTLTQYIITYDITASPTNGQTLTGVVTSITCTNAVNNNDSTDATLTIDVTAPTTTDNQTSSNWQATEKAVILTPNDGTGSGVTAATGIYGCFSTGCSPVVLGGNSMTTNCGAGNECTYDVRYYSVDNVGNTESTKTSTYQARIDRKTPTDGTLSAPTVGDGQLSLIWSGFSDSGSGLNTTDAYKLVFLTTGFPNANCSNGTDLTAVTTQTSYTHTGLTNGWTYYYRICAYDRVNNISAGVTTSAIPSRAPILSYPTAPYDDGKNPDTGDITTNFTFKVIYTDPENDAPASGYPKIYIGDNDDEGYPSYNASYTMTAEDPGDITYSDGKTYYFTTGLGAAEDLRFYFEAQAALGNLTVVKLPSNAPTGYNTASVYLMSGYNMVGVPKELDSGLPYYSVLGDDSGYPYCIFWDSPGPDTGGGFSDEDWTVCTSENIENGKGYYIWANDPGTYRLDEPSDVENVTAPSVDIVLDPDGGWTMISNPYNANIELQSEKVKVVRSATEYTFSEAVSNNWIYNSIYEWWGYVSGYKAKRFNGSPPATLEPWVGCFIYVKDAIPTTLRVYKPVP